MVIAQDTFDFNKIKFNMWLQTVKYQEGGFSTSTKISKNNGESKYGGMLLECDRNICRHKLMGTYYR